LLPSNPVVPSEKSYHYQVSLGPLAPTPPPDAIAQTKYYYEERGSGSDGLIKMWVSSVRHVGPLTICEGWMLRYPQAHQSAFGNGTQITIGGPTGGGLLPPIVEAHASIECSERSLVPFASSAATSP
jgi:hypothetical protein